MKKKVFVTTLLFIFLSVAVTFAYGNRGQGRGMDNPPPDRGRNMQVKGNLFADIDANSDGKISKDEFQKFHDDFFNLADQNKDGVITQEEFFEAHRTKRKANRFSRMDKNKDGKVTLQEFEDVGYYRNAPDCPRVKDCPRFSKR